MSVAVARKPRRYALVGAGGRANMFLDPIADAKRYREGNELVGICDVNEGRLRFHQQRLVEQFGYREVPIFQASGFEEMVRQTRPDVVIVATVDATHHEYIVRAMELGCDAIVEKPMTIDAEKCQAIWRAIEKTGRRLRVTFNCRFGPGALLVKRLLSEGVIGEVLHADMEYLLDTSHGADFFRRWHREKDKSGGLLVHKATHHFDMVNWWLDAVPEEVFGWGRLAFYGGENARRRGVEVAYEHYTEAAKEGKTAGDPFAMDLTRIGAEGRKLYWEAKEHDGYRRDRNVFGEGITIEDTMSALVKYRTGVVLNYSLNAYLPREGFGVVFNGTKGRLEYQEALQAHILEAADKPLPGDAVKWESQCVVLPMFKRPYRVAIPAAEGGHGGADPELQERMFSANPPADEWGRDAGHGQGSASIMVGIAANESFKSGRAVKVADLCPQIGGARRLHELP